MLKRKSAWIGILFIGVTFYFLFRNIEPRKLYDSLLSFDLPWLLPALAIYLLGYILRGFRWVVLLNPVKKCRFGSLFPTLIIGFTMNNILPARLGEFIRAHLNGKKEGISRSASLATIILERLFDGLVMVLMLGVSLKWGHLPLQAEALDPKIRVAIDLSPWVFGAAFFVLFLMILFRKAAERTAAFFIGLAPERLRPALSRISNTFIQGLETLKSPAETFQVLLYSTAAWTCEFASYYLLALGFGLAPHPVTFFTAALIMAVVNLAILIPNAPGGIGLFEFFGVALLMPLGVVKEMAVGYMFFVHAVVLIPITLMGLFYFAKEGLSFSSIQSEKEREDRK